MAGSKVTQPNQAPGDRTRQIQRNLYLAAKRHPVRKFRRLYQTMTRRDILERAYDEVRANKGAAGVDGITIRDIEHGEGRTVFLDRLQQDLKAGRYHPMPVRRVYIPKAQGGQRPLGIPSIRDRVVQTAAKLVLEPIFEAQFLANSYGFRPKRNAIMALEAIRESGNAGYLYVVDADIRQFFDHVNHEKMLLLVDEHVNDPQMRKLVRQFLEDAVMEGSTLTRPKEGTPQGGPISPLLANIYLHYLDRLWQHYGRNLGRLVRYADDAVILCHTKEAAERSLKLLGRIVARLDIELHPDKTRIVDLTDGEEGFDFLGFTFRRIPSVRKPGQMYLMRWPSRRSQQRVREKIREATAPRALLTLSLEEMVARIAPIIRGWGAYFRWGNSSDVFSAIDSYVNWRLAIFLRKKHQRRNLAWTKAAKGGGILPLLKQAGVPHLSGTVQYGQPATATR